MSNLESCPRCNSVDTCHIAYGYPGDIEKYLKLVAEKKIYSGGCVIDSDNPIWYCNNCDNKWGKFNSDKTDSFDFDQGFNIDEVYDQ